MHLKTLLGFGLLAGLASAVPGGRTTVDVSDESVQTAAKFAADAYGTYDSIDIKSAERQVVAGLKYYITYDVYLDDQCTEHVVGIWDHFGELSVTERTIGDC